MPGTAVVQALSLYKAKVTEPVGLKALTKVALSPVIAATPTTPVVGLAVVVMVGLARLTVTGSFAQALLEGALFVSPL